METITHNLQHSIETKLKGENGKVVKEIYARTGNKPLWVGMENSEKISTLIQALKDPIFNYKNKSFDQKSIKKLLYYLDNNTIPTSKKAAVYARLDLLLTNSYVRLVRFITEGDVDWQLVQKKFEALKESDDIQATWEMKPRPFPPLDPLVHAVDNGDIREYLLSLIPMEKRYLKLAFLGILIYAGFGVGCMILGKNFLDYAVLHKWMPATDAIMARSHSMLGVEIGVAFTVSAIMFAIYANLASRGELKGGL